MTDTRRVVGGVVWAKASAISRDAGRIYGSHADSKWIHGIMLEVITKKPDGARRATTLIKAMYQFGPQGKMKIIGLQQLKARNPNPISPSIQRGSTPTTTTTNNVPPSLQNPSGEQATNETTAPVSPPVTNAAVAASGTAPGSASSSNSSSTSTVLPR